MFEERVLAIVLNYNGILFTKDLFLKTIDSLSKQNYKNLEIFVIDNNSSDKSVIKIEQKFPNIRIIQLKKNIATIGYNIGISLFLKDKFNYLLLCNNDMLFNSDFVTEMVYFSKKIPEAGLITPRIMMLSDKDVYNSTGIIINKTGFAWDRNFNDRESVIGIPHSSEVAAASGGAMFCTKEAIDSVKGFDPIYHAYYEDVDFSFRMRRITGKKIFYNSKAVCYHSFSMSWGENPMKEFYMIRNRYIFILTHFELQSLIHSLRFMFFSVRHPIRRINRKIFFSLFILMPLIFFNRLKMVTHKPFSKDLLEKFAGFPTISTNKVQKMH